jgi:hypothetical protein
MSIVFLFDENPDVASAGSGGAAVGGARSAPDHAARSNSERAPPSAGVGRRYSAVRWSGINRLDEPGSAEEAWVGRPRWLRILTITGGSSIAAMIFKAPPQFGVVFDVDVDLSGANAVLESLSDWHRKLIEIGRARWGFTASATW